MPAKIINPTNTFKVFECCVHPGTDIEDLHPLMMRVFRRDRPHAAALIDEFERAQGAVVLYTSRVDRYDRRDPICALDVTIPDDTKAIYFKMLFTDG